MKRAVALGTAAGVLGLAGTALASGSASAYVIHPTSTSTANVAAGTSYTSNSTSSQVSFTSSDGSSTYAFCTTSALNGKTTLNGSTSGTSSNGINVTSGSFGGCKSAGANITVTGNFSPAWQLTPTSNPSTNVFGGTVQNVSVTLSCGATYGGTISGGTENNANPSFIKLTNAGSLSRTAGSGCVAVPTTVYVNGTWTLATVNGATANASNNLWLATS